MNDVRRTDSKLSRRNRAYKLLAAITASLVLLSACSAAPAAEETKAQTDNAQATTLKVGILKVTNKPIGKPEEVIGDIVPSVTMDITPKGNGDVIEVFKKRGDFVKKGELLARLDTEAVRGKKRRAEIALQKARADLTKAEADKKFGKKEKQDAVTKAERDLEKQQKELNKLKNGYDEGTVEKSEVDKFEATFKNSVIDLEALKTKLFAHDSQNTLLAEKNGISSAELDIQEANQTLQHADIKAPTTGLLTEWNLLSGMNVAQGTKQGQITNIDPITVKAKLTETALEFVKGKKALTFYISGNSQQTYTGTISYLSEVMDVNTRTYTLELKADNAKRLLKPGIKIQLRLENESARNVPAIPTTSIIREHGATFVFIYKDGAALKRPVKLGALVGSEYEVIDGLQAGETIIVAGQHEVKDKQRVELTK
ncbi:efflux RND transporter periplasmic adaptor subunit [Paenibacillus sp. 481]|uniref:efflux RND transporter periplasmic adaptor subunit n=1 Tax=Paenibacillus sp. 481 TaxID=2835869 RepID=UPI001E3D9FCF|nr:efflux RND transporter periplasmic adaptor subunit [Paenibacillus sp. 481]UHA74826.1 efflux RND transporter periplasmic adaptor subunit [Paenibacillus sp. 481]